MRSPSNPAFNRRSTPPWPCAPSGRLEEALRALANPNEYNPYLYTVRGEIEFALGLFHDAALSYFAVVQSEPDNGDAHYNLALCLQRSDRWDASCQAFERALSLDAGRDAARLGLGASLLYLNRLEEALANFHECSPAHSRRGYVRKGSDFATAASVR